MTNTVNNINAKLRPLSVKFINANRVTSDKSPLPSSSSVGFLSKSGNGISIIFNERVSYVPGDKLYVHMLDHTSADEEAGDV